MRRKLRRSFDRIDRKKRLTHLSNQILKWTFIVITVFNLAFGIYGIIIGKWYYLIAPWLPVLAVFFLSGPTSSTDVLWMIFMDKDKK